ncbi:MAG: class I SAM-dependent methyltransferase [Actinomycetota bacterium]|nr:class I SAM-dependent methyltransferase [Actinomycetota bacterium]
MLPAAQARMLRELADDALVLDVGGWAAPFNRATHMIDAMPYETRGALGYSFGGSTERFSRETWVQRDICDREPWPYPDDWFDFVLCVTTLEDVRDPIWVCSEMSRVAKAGYVEVPAVELELTWEVGAGGGPYLGHAHHRWLCDLVDGELVFTHKPHSIHSDWRLRVTTARNASMTVEEQLIGHFWEGAIAARERLFIVTSPHDELIDRVRRRFPPSRRELALKRARERARRRAASVARPAREALARALAR